MNSFPDVVTASVNAEIIGDVDALVEYYDSTISRLLDTHAPPMMVKLRDRPANDWFDDACTDARIRSRYLERRYGNTRADADRETWHDSLNAMHALFNAKRTERTMRSIKEAQGDSSELWRALNTTMGNTASKAEYVHSAEDFADFFANKISKIRQETANSPYPIFAADSPAVLPQFVNVSVAQTIALINESPTKHSDADPLPTWLLKECSIELAPFLTALFNLSLTRASFPLKMKMATVIPLLKKENLDARELKNYRPVSNLSFISKLLERVASKQLVEYLEGNGLLPERQSAYRVGHSCETALLRIHSDLVAAADNGNISLIALLDLRAAFDCVDHDILLQRLRCNYGLGQPIVSWLHSYITGRMQCVRCNNDKSTVSVVSSGVPQGSVLGPLLFLLYTAEVLEVIRTNGLHGHGYADDTQIYGSCTPADTATLRSNMLRCIDDVTAWTSSNRLKLNPEKSEFMWCATSRMQHHIDRSPFVIGGVAIEPQLKVQLLGVTLDSDLSMSSHVSRTISSCFYQLRRLKSIRRALPVEATKTLVSALVFARCDNQNGLFIGVTQRQIDRLQQILNASARLIYGGTKRDHVTLFLRDKLHWLRFRQRITYKLCLTVYKALHEKSPKYIRELIIPASRNAARARLRSAKSDTNTVVCPRVRHYYGERGFSFAGPSAWNNLSAATRQSQSLESFKSALKTELFAVSYS